MHHTQAVLQAAPSRPVAEGHVRAVGGTLARVVCVSPRYALVRCGHTDGVQAAASGVKSPCCTRPHSQCHHTSHAEPQRGAVAAPRSLAMGVGHLSGPESDTSTLSWRGLEGFCRVSGGYMHVCYGVGPSMRLGEPKGNHIARGKSHQLRAHDYIYSLRGEDPAGPP
jgi:hypothetical protein